MIIVDPDHVTILSLIRDSIRKECIGLFVCHPGRFIKDYLTGMVMK